MSSLHLVFVYGSLRQGRPNHYRLLEVGNGLARYLGLATTTDRYPLVIASRYNIPYLLAAPGQGQHVRGEVYEVDDKMLETLDALENHPKYYERKFSSTSLYNKGANTCNFTAPPTGGSSDIEMEDHALQEALGGSDLGPDFFDIEDLTSTTSACNVPRIRPENMPDQDEEQEENGD